MHTTRSSARHRPPLPLLLLALIALLLLASGCAASLPTTLPPTVSGPQLPPLPTSARQTAQPSICLPNCSDALTSERESWRQSLTLPAPVATPASAPTMPPVKP